MTFDPNAAAAPDSGIFGLTTGFDDSEIVLLPIPFDATTSYGNGAHRGPGAVLEASKQVDLLDHHFGNVYGCGIFMDSAPTGLLRLGRAMRKLAEPIIARGGAGPRDRAAIRKINAAGDRVNAETYAFFKAALASGRTPGLLGGDHSTPFGAIKASAEAASTEDRAGGLGILHFDAHMDLRNSFEGFAWSHASIMHNVISMVPEVKKLVQVGIRDYGEGEVEFARSHADRVDVHFDADIAEALLEGSRFGALCKAWIRPLPKQVHISFDIDALDPSLCPHTGTPVPGGLSFNQAAILLNTLARSGRRVVSFDLVEVCPGGTTPIDAATGARVLYKLCGAAAVSNGAD
ncbi:MAG: agmatinase family protein [Phycisphaerales bacterium]